MSWTKQSSLERIRKAIEELDSVEVVDLVRETGLDSIPLNKAYRIDGVHSYAAITNAMTLLGSDGREGERVHRRLLRFLHIFQRVARSVFRSTDAVKVDFQNHRLHYVIYKPYDDRRAQVAAAVAVGALLHDLVAGANELHEDLPDAELTVGIEAGVSLAVNNGTRGDREPLFLGDPANQAAKLLGTKGSIYLGGAGRDAMGTAWQTDRPADKALTADEIRECTELAALEMDAETLLDEWREELEDTPLAEFTFHRATPPLSDLDLDSLTPGNSCRLELVAVTADIDGFTRFVGDRMAAGDGATVVRILHVIRKELRDVLNDFGGRKIRYIGDCLQGVVAEGTSKTTDETASVSTGVLCAGAMRDSFGLVLQELPEAAELGLAIGLELGPVTITRLGVNGQRDRCVVGRAVLASQETQEECNGEETGLGAAALAVAPAGIRALFEDNHIQAGITFNKVVFALREQDEEEQMGRLNIPPAAPSIVFPRAFAT